MTPTMRVPVRSTVRYTELGTVILGGGGPHQINSQIHRAGDSYTGEGESPHQIYNQVYRAGNSYTGGGWEFDSCIWVEIGG